MSFLAWILLGMVTGLPWRKVINKGREGMILDTVLGIVGACLGGDLFSILGAHGVTGMNLYSLLVAVIGSVIFLIVYNAIGRGQQRRRWDDGAGQWSSAQEGLH